MGVPFANDVHARYLLDSPASAALAGILHLVTAREYLAFHLVLACVAIVVPFYLDALRRSPELRLAVALLLVGGTVPALLLSWVGSYDPVSIGSAAVAALASNPVVRALAWMVFAFNNAPEAAIALVIFAVVLWADSGRAAVPRIFSSGVGAVAGYVAIRVLTSAWDGGQSEFTEMKFYGFHQYRSVTSTCRLLSCPPWVSGGCSWPTGTSGTCRRRGHCSCFHFWRPSGCR
jgi:hypothetical protein